MKLLSTLFTAVLITNHAAAQDAIADPEYSYADLADLALSAPIVARGEIDRAIRIDEERAMGVAPGHVRYYVEIELSALIRSDNPVPREISYIIDAPLTAEGRRPRLKNRDVVIMARPIPGSPNSVQLIAPDAQIDWSESREARIRGMLSEVASPDAPGIVTGVGSAFSVPGALPGESETQIFLSTSEGRPVSLSILRRPSQRPRWSVALGEIVDRTTPPPARDTLLWYRLACFLPDSLPMSVMENGDPAQVDRARQDYRLVIQDLGSCPRYRS